MWIVRLALRRPYTFVVLALVVLILGPLVILRTPTDIFPNINIPVVSVIWNYGGLSAPEMANRIVSGYERGLTTTVNDIEHIESQTLSGISVIKIFFQPTVHISEAVAQVTAISLSAVRSTIASSKRALSADEVGRDIGVARVTARRYLDYLDVIGAVRVERETRGPGRPLNRYHYVGARSR